MLNDGERHFQKLASVAHRQQHLATLIESVFVGVAVVDVHVYDRNLRPRPPGLLRPFKDRRNCGGDSIEVTEPEGLVGRRGSTAAGRVADGVMGWRPAEHECIAVAPAPHRDGGVDERGGRHPCSRLGQLSRTGRAIGLDELAGRPGRDGPLSHLLQISRGVRAVPQQLYVGCLPGCARNVIGNCCSRAALRRPRQARAVGGAGPLKKERPTIYFESPRINRADGTCGHGPHADRGSSHVVVEVWEHLVVPLYVCNRFVRRPPLRVRPDLQGQRVRGHLCTLILIVQSKGSHRLWATVGNPRKAQGEWQYGSVVGRAISRSRSSMHFIMSRYFRLV